jgi:hypothetical protein
LWEKSSLDEPREGEEGSYVALEIESWGDDPEKACLHNELQQRCRRASDSMVSQQSKLVLW